MCIAHLASMFVRVKGFPMYGGMGVSAPSLHRESTDSLIASYEYVHKDMSVDSIHAEESLACNLHQFLQLCPYRDE